MCVQRAVPGEGGCGYGVLAGIGNLAGEDGLVVLSLIAKLDCVGSGLHQLPTRMFSWSVYTVWELCNICVMGSLLGG